LAEDGVVSIIESDFGGFYQTSRSGEAPEISEGEIIWNFKRGWRRS
jgi:hypothetical protein